MSEQHVCDHDCERVCGAEHNALAADLAATREALRQKDDLLRYVWELAGSRKTGAIRAAVEEAGLRPTKGAPGIGRDARLSFRSANAERIETLERVLREVKRRADEHITGSRDWMLADSLDTTTRCRAVLVSDTDCPAHLRKDRCKCRHCRGTCLCHREARPSDA